MEGRETLRLDKWLWQARFFKTRTLATEKVSRGKVRLNGRLVKKPATGVGAGDVLTFVQGAQVRVIRITGMPRRRGPASEAASLFEDITES
ncbi:MAG: RNA-binding S4 domain-containing protein [Alphaproteobacteria bacterium]|nr:RNA-binding S4 domain-containing protein [Alphaproteobacteria bacterium]